MTYFEHNERKHLGSVSLDTVEMPDIQVTEEEATPDTMRRFHDAEERRALELIPWRD